MLGVAASDLFAAEAGLLAVVRCVCVRGPCFVACGGMCSI